MTGSGWQGASAIAAWNANLGRQRGIDAELLPGDSCYFRPAPENEGFGHVGVVTGPDEFTSVTYYGVKTYNISSWGAPLLGSIRYWA